MTLTVFSKINCMQCTDVCILLDTKKIKYNKIIYSSLFDLVNKESLNEESEEIVINIGSFPIIKSDTKYMSYQEVLSRFDEPLIEDNEGRFTIYPIKYHDIFQMYKKARASFWQPEEISLKDDLRDWNNMTRDEQHFVSHILAFFSASDGIVNENLNLNFGNEVQFPEARAFYTFQTAIESIHSETYGLLLDKYIENPVEKIKLQRGMQTIESVKKKANWALKWTSSDRTFAERLIAFACVEGLMFSGSFCAIFWIKKRGLLPGLAFSNELISRDEGLHTDFAILLYTKYIKHKIPQSIVWDIVKEAVAYEKEFIIESLPCKLIGMNSDFMSQYIEFVADRLLLSLGYQKIWNSKLPDSFDFMENLSLLGKTNFFEKRVGEYAKAGVMDSGEVSFNLEEDF